MAFSSRTMTPADWAELKHFKPTDRGFPAPEKMGYEFMKWLDQLRAKVNRPLVISSSFRDPKHNTKVGGATASAHMMTPCEAVDITNLDGPTRFKVVYHALALGCRRIGVYENGSVHVDRAGAPKPQDTLWVKV